MSPNLRRIQSDTARRNQAMRDMDAYPWPRDPSVSLSKLVIFGLTPICVAVWAAERFL